MLKIRLGVSGFLGAIGMKILGIPGLIFGFFSGMIATKWVVSLTFLEYQK